MELRASHPAQDVLLSDVAKRTAGFSGADLENLMNESAILAARRNKKDRTSNSNVRRLMVTFLSVFFFLSCAPFPSSASLYSEARVLRHSEHPSPCVGT